ncbi:MAG: 3-deoxy-manno-octulosonate cytidylyltransferase [Methylococcales bacterium]|nr:3-deoxy-manno-octulosonate cytidylyltransferase [Methylococcales bacterium]
MGIKFKVVIPARYGSTRLPGKPLQLLAGKPMISYVCEQALKAKAEEVVVATDDQRIIDRVAQRGVDVMMTREDHNSGTERLFEVAESYGWSDETIVVNLQGDEPLIPPDYIRLVAEQLASQTRASVATLAAPVTHVEELFNPNAVKVVLNKGGYALYFSRAPIPWDRDKFPNHHDNELLPESSFRHIGLYAYSVGFLRRYMAWDSSPLEGIENLEQLRILWQGEAIKVGAVAQMPDAGIDTLEDLQRVEQLLLHGGLKP